MDGKMLARLGAVVFAAVAISAAVIELTRKDDALAFSPVQLRQSAIDPLRENQRRCQQLGQQAVNNTDCLRIWAETRDRFLSRTRAPVSPAFSEGQ